MAPRKRQTESQDNDPNMGPSDSPGNQERPFRADKTEPTNNNPEPPNSNVSSSADDTPLTASFEDLGSV
ncbi:hypothetical protein FOFC_03144 [Fusarium oxysporum]|nr:hypothetical protein FOFC_03144 [Fusarium oxysporum]